MDKRHQATFHTSDYPLRDSVILDSGTALHIFNDKSRFVTFEPAEPGDGVYAGNKFVPVQGYGDALALVQTPQGKMVMSLYGIAFIESFACNIVSLRQLHKKGYWWDNKAPENCLRRKDDSIVCHLSSRHGQFVMEYNPQENTTAAFATGRRRRYNSRTERAPKEGEAHLWHLRMGHCGPETLKHLEANTEGVKLHGPTTVQCSACGVSKITKQTRREPREATSRPGQRLAVNFLEIEDDPEGRDRVMFITDRYSRKVWMYILDNKSTATLMEKFADILGILKNQYQMNPEVIECDNEIADNNRLSDWHHLAALGSSPQHHEPKNRTVAQSAQGV